MSTGHGLESLQRKETQLRKCLHEIDLAVSIFLISDQWGRALGRAQSIVGGATPGLVVLGSIRKQAEQASKQHLHGLYISCCLQVPALCESLPSLLLMMNCYMEL